MAKAATPALHVIITSALPLPGPIGHLPAMFVIKLYDPERVSAAVMALVSA